MYGPSQPLNIPSRIGAGERDDGSGNEPAVDGHHHHIQYETHALDDGAAGGAVVVEDVTSDAVYVSGGGGPVESSQLTLSFRGQVYVFDAVTPDKVPFPPFSVILLFNFLLVFVDPTLQLNEHIEESVNLIIYLFISKICNLCLASRDRFKRCCYCWVDVNYLQVVRHVWIRGLNIIKGYFLIVIRI